MKSAEKFVDASYAQALCGIAFTFEHLLREPHQWYSEVY